MQANRLTGDKAGFFDLMAVGLIVVYQKIFSPLKGFSCAYRCRHGGPSCSEYVKQTVLRRGLASGLADIRARFDACRLAARQLNSSFPGRQSGAVDCGLDGCGDFGGFDSCFGDSGAEGGGSSTTIIIFPFGLLLILIFVVASSDWFKAPLVSAIDIRLMENQQEAQEQGVARLLGGNNPDYQVVFIVNGRKIVTNTLSDSSAKTWLRLEPKSGFEIADIDRFTIVNKQLLEDIVLDTIDDPEPQGKGAFYEYRFTED